jgi:cytochrome c oxidase assembly factor CtaG
MMAWSAIAGPVLAQGTGGPIDLPVLLVILTGAGYTVAIRRTHGTSEAARRSMQPRERRRAIWFAVALAAVLVALTEPIERYADDLFWVHMVQHVLLFGVAAPLLALSAPWRFAPALLSRPTRRRVIAWWHRAPSWRRVRTDLARLAGPAAAWVLFDANLAVWHLPVAFDLTLRNAVVHDLEHVLFLGLGVLFWRHAFAAPSVRGRLIPVHRAVYATAASVVGWGVAIVLTFAPSPLYAPYAAAAATGGLSALADQRIAAGIMLVPGSIPFVVAALASLACALADDPPARATSLALGRAAETRIGAAR